MGGVTAVTNDDSTGLSRLARSHTPRRRWGGLKKLKRAPQIWGVFLCLKFSMRYAKHPIQFYAKHAKVNYAKHPTQLTKKLGKKLGTKTWQEKN